MRLLPEPLAVFGRGDERLDQFGLHEVAAGILKIPQPEVVAGVVRGLPLVGVAAQVSEVLHQHEGAIPLGRVKGQGLRDFADDRGAAGRRVISRQFNDERLPLGRVEWVPGPCVELVNEGDQGHRGGEGA